MPPSRPPRTARATRRTCLVGLFALLALATSTVQGRAGAAPDPARTLLTRISLPLGPAVRLLPPRPPARRTGYGWPLRPFDRPHPIRGAFGDPRFGAVQRNFHFGVDIPAPGGTPVYAVAAGTVFLEPDRVDVLTSWRPSVETGFSYWHVVPAVREDAVVRRHALLGWVKTSWAHLHFSELKRGHWVNPLRPGALTPAPGPLVPSIHSVTVEPLRARGQEEAAAVVVDASARAVDRPAPPWQGVRLAPSLIRWRLVSGGAALTPWRDAVDFRDSIPANALYHDVYAPGTRQNRPGHPGRYRFYLARDWNVERLPPGSYTLEVQAFGTSGERTTATTSLTVPLDAPSSRADLPLLLASAAR